MQNKFYLFSETCSHCISAYLFIQWRKRLTCGTLCFLRFGFVIPNCSGPALHDYLSNRGTQEKQNLSIHLWKPAYLAMCLQPPAKIQAFPLQIGALRNLPLVRKWKSIERVSESVTKTWHWQISVPFAMEPLTDFIDFFQEDFFFFKWKSHSWR